MTAATFCPTLGVDGNTLVFSYTQAGAPLRGTETQVRTAYDGMSMELLLMQNDFLVYEHEIHEKAGIGLVCAVLKK